MTISQALAEAKSLLHDAGIPEPSKEASSLLAFALKCDRTYLIAHCDDDLTKEESISFESLVQRRASHEPYQYIVGVQEFFGLEFEVTPAVLIPRPETEILVEAAIEFLSTKDQPTFCEIGVGSGCISVSILKKLPDARAIAVDISTAALDQAIANARKHNVDDRINFMISDVYASVPVSRFDAIVSNPPYVPAVDLQSLQAEVRDHEPTVALMGGASGLDVIERVINGAYKRLFNGGVLLVEIGFKQSALVDVMLGRESWVDVGFLPDLQGIPRILKTTKRATDQLM